MTEQEFMLQRGIKTASLTKTEQRLLNHLQLHSGRIITRQELLENVWETHSQVNTRTVDIHISHLGRKLHLWDEIRTIVKVGYVFGGECVVEKNSQCYDKTKFDARPQC